MALDLDGYAVLRAIGSEWRLFADVKVEARKAAKALVLKQLKAKSADLKSLAAIHAALGAQAFALLVESMTDAEAKTLVGRFDKHNAEARAAPSSWRRQHLIALARGKAEPAAKPARKAAGGKKATAGKKAAARKKATKSGAGVSLYSKAMAAVRKRS